MEGNLKWKEGFSGRVHWSGRIRCCPRPPHVVAKRPETRPFLIELSGRDSGRPPTTQEPVLVPCSRAFLPRPGHRLLGRLVVSAAARANAQKGGGTAQWNGIILDSHLFVFSPASEPDTRDFPAINRHNNSLKREARHPLRIVRSSAGPCEPPSHC